MAKRQKIVKQRSHKPLPTVKKIRRMPKPPAAKSLLAGTDKIPLYEKTDKRTKIAIIQTGSWGDNINSTLMLPPLHKKYPNCIIDVYTSTYFESAFHNNPLITNLIRHTADSKQSALHLTLTIPKNVENRGYDLVLAPHPMFNPDNWTSINTPSLGINIICAWIRALEHNDIPYKMPLETVLRLTTQEVHKVNRFCTAIPKFNDRDNILMEVQGESGQSFWDHTWTMDVCKHLLQNPKVTIYISRKHDGSDVAELQQIAPGRIYFVGGLSLRECAELYNKCKAFFSCSSGLSNACNTNWCKNNIIWIETTNSPSVTSAPIRSSGKTFWHENDKPAFLHMLKKEHGL